MDIRIKELKDIKSKNCITVILNTHRTFPDNQKDEILLKNMVKEVQDRINENTDKREAKILTDKLNALADSIDHRQNLESLILFVNEDISEYTRLAIPVVDRVIIDKSFATRDLIRALHTETNYYVLVLSRGKARLIEAFNDKVVEEVSSSFPIENTDLYTTSGVESANSTRVGNLVSEFFNRIDKAVNEIRKNNPLPVLVCSDETNYHEYLKVADNKSSILNIFLNRSNQNEKANAIIADAWEVLREDNQRKNNERKSELSKAVTENKFLSDSNEIYKAIQEGRIQTLFIEQGLFQPAVILNGNIQYVSEEQTKQADVIDDIYDELIELNMDYGGDVVFLPKGDLDKFNGFGAITRY